MSDRVVSVNIAQPERAITELKDFIALTETAPTAPGYGRAGTANPRTVGDKAAVLASAQVVEQILDRVLPNWRTEISQSYTSRWQQHREAAIRAIAVLERDTEVREILGDDAPRLSAAALHPWVWGSAGPLWLDGYYQQAVTTAAIKVSAEAQAKTGVKTRTEHDLITQLFKTDAATAGNPRLRLMPNDGSKNFTNVHEGVGALARGAYMAIRNPNSHTLTTGLTEHEALEQLAVFSQLARWIDTATLETVP